MQNLHNDHNVYILGAGFSVGAGLPMISNFLTQMRDSHPWLKENNRKEEMEAVEKVLRFRLDAASAAYWTNLDLENIEELFSLASASTSNIDRDTRLAIAATIDYADSSFREQNSVEDISFWKERDIPLWVKNAPWLRPTVTEVGNGYRLFQCDRYVHYIAKLLGMFTHGAPYGENTIISFNYDTLVEEALQKMDLQYCYGFKAKTVNFADTAFVNPRPESPSVLKLHGSLNWARRNGPGRSLTVYDDYSQVRANGLVPELVPPTWKKTFQNQLSDVWEAAVESLQTATRVVIIGFSIPPTDMHFKYLIAAGLQQNVSLRKIIFINPSANELKERARMLFREGYMDSKILFLSEKLEGVLNNPDFFKDTLGRPWL